MSKLPAEIEAAMDTMWTAAIDDWSADATADAVEGLRHAILAALDERDTALRESLDRLSAELRAQRAMPPIWFGEDPALRERCERLRLIVIAANQYFSGDPYPVEPGDLADDLHV